MANVFVSNGANYLEFPTLGNLNGKEVRVVLKNTTWTAGYLWSQANASSASRELGAYVLGGVQIIGGGKQNELGNFDTVFGGPLDLSEVDMTVGAAGEVSVLTDGGVTYTGTITRQTNRVDGEPFRIFARGGGYNAADGDVVGDFEVWVDGVKVRDVTMPASNSDPIVDNIDPANNGVLVGGDGDDFAEISPADPVDPVDPVDPADPADPVVVVKQPKQYEVLVGFGQGEGAFLLGECGFTFNITGGGLLEYRLVNEIDVVTGYGWDQITSGEDFEVMIPAAKAWYRLEIRKDGVSQGHTNVFGCGGKTVCSGQSQAERFIHIQSTGDTRRLSDFGIAPSPYHSIQYDGTDSADNTDYRQSDGSAPLDAVGVVDYLNRKIEETGVNWSYAAFTRGGQSIQSWTDDTAIRTKFRAWLDLHTRFNEFLWWQGGTDALYRSYGSYLSRLNDLIGYVEGVAEIPFAGFMTPYQNTNNAQHDDPALEAGIKRAHWEFAQNNPSFTSFHPVTIELTSDGVHENQQGTLDISRALIRAQRSNLVGADYTGFTRNGPVLDIKFAFNEGADSLVATGDPLEIINISLRSDPYVKLVNQSIQVNADNVILTLADDPGTDELLIWVGSSLNSDGLSFIRDNYDGDEFAEGRELNATIDYADGAMIYAEPRISGPTPTAIAGQNITATVGQAIQLTGATVTDADAVAWTCTSGQTPTIVNGDTLTPTITFNEPGAHTLRITATNAVGGAFAELQATVEDVATVIQSTILLSLPGIPDGAHDVVIVDRVGGINLTVEGVTFADGTGSALIPLAIGSAVDYYTYNETTREAGLQVEGITT